MHTPTAPSCRLFALALLAWMAMVFTPSSMAMPMPAGTDMPGRHAAAAPTGMHITAAHGCAEMTDHAPCCGHPDHGAVGCHECGCIEACAAAVLPPTGLVVRASSVQRESVLLECSRLAAMITAPPLRPPLV